MSSYSTQFIPLSTFAFCLHNFFKLIRTFTYCFGYLHTIYQLPDLPHIHSSLKSTYSCSFLTNLQTSHIRHVSMIETTYILCSYFIFNCIPSFFWNSLASQPHLTYYSKPSHSHALSAQHRKHVLTEWKLENLCNPNMTQDNNSRESNCRKQTSA